MADETGAVAVVMAILLVSMLLITAYIVELGLLRSDRLVTKSVADMAAAAATSIYRPTDTGGPQVACLAALRYADANLPDDVGLLNHDPADVDCVSTFPSTETCMDLDGAGETAVYSRPPYVLRITMPVPSGPLLSGAVHGVSGLDYGAYDGAPCDRVAVSLDRDRSALVFGGFVGNDPNTIAATSVGRVGAGPQGEEYASLVVLKPHGCGTMETNGNDTLIEVQGATIAGVYYPGVIVVDTASACTSPPNGRIFEPSNGARPGIRSSDEIESNALRLGASRVLPEVNPELKIEPAVIPGPPRTRLIVDDRYNCLDPYPTDEVWSPKYYTPRLPEAERDCDTGADGAPPYPYISRLHGAYQGLTLADALLSPDWSVYPDDLSHLNAGCRNVGSTTTIFDLGPSHQTGSSSGRRWFINCEGVNPATTLQPNQLRFLGVEAIVGAGSINVTNSLTITGSAAQGAVLYLKNGDFERSSNNAQAHLTNTFVYLNSGTLAWGSSSAGASTWGAPLGSTIKSSCEAYSGSGAPPAGCFSPLALWTNSSAAHTLSGGVVLNISGSFFTPNADPFELGGNNNQTLDQAQFFSGSLKASGNSTITLMPNPDTNIPSPAQELRVLIR